MVTIVIKLVEVIKRGGVPPIIIRHDLEAEVGKKIGKRLSFCHFLVVVHL